MFARKNCSNCSFGFCSAQGCLVVRANEQFEQFLSLGMSTSTLTASDET